MTPTRTRRAGRLAVAALLTAGLLLVACGDDDDPEATDTTDAPTDSSADSTDGETSESSAPEDEGDVVEVELVDYAFEGLPESVPAGTKLTVTNSSEAEAHELVALLIPEDEERSVEELSELPQEELETIFAGEPATVLIAGPGGEQIDALGDGTLTEPGRYALICSIPTGADPEEILNSDGPPAEDPDAGPPHFVQGMYAELVVE